MTLGTWHSRPGGKWVVVRLRHCGWWRRYTWVARGVNGGNEGNDAPFAWLARRRAIAALDRMRAGNTNEGGR